MNRQTDQKQGVHSGSKKSASARHPLTAAPNAKPSPGAFGKESAPVMPDGKERQVSRDTARGMHKRRP